MEHTGFPSDETLAAFLDGRLDPDTRRRVVEHMTTCDECYATVTGGGEMLSGIASSPVIPMRSDRSRMARVAAAVLIPVIGLTLAAWALRSRLADRDDVAEIVKAAPHNRSFDGRLAGFPYEPRDPILRDGKNKTGDEYFQKTIQEAELQVVGVRVGKKALDHPTPENLHHLGLVHLLLQRHDEAVKALESALTTSTEKSGVIDAIHSTRDVALLNDLSVALLARWRASHKPDPMDLNLASEASQSAWLLAQTPETAWNRATTLQAMQLREAADRAWNDFLKMDRTSSWADEARREQESLHKVPSSGSAAARRTDLVAAALGSQVERLASTLQPVTLASDCRHELVPGWAAAMLRSDVSAAGRLWSAIRFVAASNRQHLGDDELSDTMVIVDAMSDADRQRFAVAVARMADTENAVADHDYAAVISILDHVASDLQRLGVHAFAARLLAVDYAYDASDFPRGIAMATEVIREIQQSGNRYPLSMSRALALRAICYSTAGRPIDALRDHEAALSLERGMGDRSAEIGLEMNIAADYAIIGDTKASWAHRLAGLALVRPEDGLRYTQMLMQAARSAMDDGFQILPRILLDGAIAMSRRNPWPDLLARSLLWRAELALQMGDPAASERDRVAALDVARSMHREGTRSFTETTPEFIEATYHDNRPAAVEALGDAIGYTREKGLQLRVVTLLLALAHDQLELGDIQAARRSVQDAVMEMDGERRGLDSPEARSFYTDGRRIAFHEGIAIMWASGAPDEALSIAEHGKARTLLDLMQSGANAPIARPNEIMRQLPEGVALVEYAVLRDRVLTWLVSQKGIRAFERRIPAVSLTQSTRDFASTILEGRPSPGGDVLYEVLVAPWIDKAEEFKTIVIVPDDELAAVPFAALRERAGAPYLIERFAICEAPSASVFLSRRPAAASSRDSVLIVAPEAGRGLPASEKEMQRVASVYRNPVVLSGDRGSVTEFLNQAAQAPVIHFAGHAEDNEEAPLLSALLFSSSSSPDHLYAYELAERRLPRLKTVFLSACATEPDRGRGLQGVAGIARAFLAAGAQSVVATLYAVGDEPSSLCGAEFHRRIAAGESAAMSLRDVQLEMIRGGRTRDWAAFVLTGTVESI